MYTTISAKFFFIYFILFSNFLIQILILDFVTICSQYESKVKGQGHNVLNKNSFVFLYPDKIHSITDMLM